MSGPVSDERVLDCIATLLGTSEQWSADHLEDIANLVGMVRPHPGDSADIYHQVFPAQTGRPLALGWDNTDYDTIGGPR